MNIKEAIERGLYPLDDKGRALVPTDLGGHAVIAATDAPGAASLLGWWDNAEGTETQSAWREDGAWWRSWSGEEIKPRPHLLPPTPRKVPVRARVECTPDGFVIRHLAKDDGSGFKHGETVELAGLHEEPWA